MVKRGHAINGDLFTLRCDAADLDVPFTTFIDVAFRGATHQAFAAAGREAFSYDHTTGEFTVGGLLGHIVETIDTVQGQGSRRFQAIVSSPDGVLSTHSYQSADELLALVGALRPEATALGIVLNPDDDVEFASAPRVALQLALGIVEVTPLTSEVIDQLPTWRGTAVSGGELYGGRFTDDSAYLTLVTPTCRVMVMPAAGVNEDDVAGFLAEVVAEWQI